MSLRRRLIPAIALLWLTDPGLAAERISLLALFESKALLHIDGQQRILSVGERSPEGVTLVRVDGNGATVETDGSEQILSLGELATFPGTGESGESPSWTGPESVTLWAEDDGFFYASGNINGFSVRFLVDTGANTIAINRRLAERLGIDYLKGTRGLATTASGVAEMYLVELDRVSIGDITLFDVEAGVLTGSQPSVPLLGMSFLGELDMERQGSRLELRRRY